MLQVPKPPINPKETSLMTHPDASMKMYDINLKKKMGGFSIAFPDNKTNVSKKIVL